MTSKYIYVLNGTAYHLPNNDAEEDDIIHESTSAENAANVLNKKGELDGYKKKRFTGEGGCVWGKA